MRATVTNRYFFKGVLVLLTPSNCRLCRLCLWLFSVGPGDSISLTEVEKASPVTIYNVVITGESIISDERVAWVSTAQKSLGEKDDGVYKGQGNSNEKGKTPKAE